VIENKLIAVEIFSLNRRKELLLEVTDEGQNRKMFSHREHGFPIGKGGKDGQAKFCLITMRSLFSIAESRN
jgi:hypothetical protein